MKLTTIMSLISILLFAGIAGCANANANSQPPGAYLEGALDWMQTHAVTSNKVDWNAVRRDAAALVPDPKSTGDTYPAIRLAISRLGDGSAFFLPPEVLNYDPGFTATLPENIVLQVRPGGAAEKAGVRVGDVVTSINGAPPRPLDGNPASIYIDTGNKEQIELVLTRAGEPDPIRVSFPQAPASFALDGKPALRRMGGDATGVGYIELVTDSGGNPEKGAYTGMVHKFMRETDQTPVCGWIVDLRRNWGGDLWTYLAAVGPLLGEGQIGGFAYPDGKRDTWTHENGKIKWNDDVRSESAVDGGVYAGKQQNPLVVLLVDRHTLAAGELVAVAFQGRPNVRVLGEPTAGFATLTDHTPLSDGAHLFVSGAYGVDRTGRVHDKPIQPDETVATDWTQFGTDRDPVIATARNWLASQPECR